MGNSNAKTQAEIIDGRTTFLVENVVENGLKLEALVEKVAQVDKKIDGLVAKFEQLDPKAVKNSFVN
jgi:hypothetical protein